MTDDKQSSVPLGSARLPGDVIPKILTTASCETAYSTTWSKPSRRRC